MDNVLYSGTRRRDMPYYIRRTNGSVQYGKAVDAISALSVRVDAGLVRAPYSDTWQTAGDGLPMPQEATVTYYFTSSSPALPSVPMDVAAVGYEDEGGLEWERAVLAVRGTRVASGGLHGTGVELRVLVAPRVAWVHRWIDDGGNDMVDDGGIPIVFLEEV